MPQANRRVILKPPDLSPDLAGPFAEALRQAVEFQRELAEHSRFVLKPAGELQEDERAFYIEHEPAETIPPAELFDPETPPASPSELINYAIGLFDALRTAQRRGTRPGVHGGVCPGCLLRAEDGTLKLADFGIAAAICTVQGMEAYLNLALSPSNGENGRPAGTGVWEVLPSWEYERNDRLCGFIDPHKYSLKALTSFESGSDVIAAGFVLHMLAEREHPYLHREPEALRIPEMAAVMPAMTATKIRRKDLRESSHPGIRAWCDLIAKSVSLLPSDRPSPDKVIEALAPYFGDIEGKADGAAVGGFVGTPQGLRLIDPEDQDWFDRIKLHGDNMQWDAVELDLERRPAEDRLSEEHWAAVAVIEKALREEQAKRRTEQLKTLVPLAAGAVERSAREILGAELAGLVDPGGLSISVEFKEWSGPAKARAGQGTVRIGLAAAPAALETGVAVKAVHENATVSNPDGQWAKQIVGVVEAEIRGFQKKALGQLIAPLRDGLLPALDHDVSLERAAPQTVLTLYPVGRAQKDARVEAPIRWNVKTFCWEYEREPESAQAIAKLVSGLAHATLTAAVAAKAKQALTAPELLSIALAPPKLPSLTSPPERLALGGPLVLSVPKRTSATLTDLELQWPLPTGDAAERILVRAGELLEETVVHVQTSLMERWRAELSSTALAPKIKFSPAKIKKPVERLDVTVSTAGITREWTATWSPREMEFARKEVTKQKAPEAEGEAKAPGQGKSPVKWVVAAVLLATVGVVGAWVFKRPPNNDVVQRNDNVAFNAAHQANAGLAANANATFVEANENAGNESVGNEAVPNANAAAPPKVPADVVQALRDRFDYLDRQFQRPRRETMPGLLTEINSFSDQYASYRDDLEQDDIELLDQAAKEWSKQLEEYQEDVERISREMRVSHGELQKDYNRFDHDSLEPLQSAVAQFLTTYEPRRVDLSESDAKLLDQVQQWQNDLGGYEDSLAEADQAATVDEIKEALVQAKEHWPTKRMKDALQKLDIIGGQIAPVEALAAKGGAYLKPAYDEIARVLKDAEAIGPALAPVRRRLETLRDDVQRQLMGADAVLLGRINDWLSANGDPPADRIPATAKARAARALLDELPYKYEDLDDLPEVAAVRGRLAAWTTWHIPLDDGVVLPVVFVPYRTLTGTEASFWMGQTEVTVQQYNALLRAGTSGDPDMPVGDISASSARAFCSAMSSKVGRFGVATVRVPLVEEWQAACMAGRSDFLEAWPNLKTLDAEGRPVLDLPRVNFKSDETPGMRGMGLAKDGFGGAAPVWRTGVHVCGPNRWGLFDMPGNVGEWADAGRTPLVIGGSWDQHITVVEEFVDLNSIVKNINTADVDFLCKPLICRPQVESSADFGVRVAVLP